MSERRTLAAAMWSTVTQASRLTMGGEAAYRVLVAMLSEVDTPEYIRTGKLVSWPSLRRLRERTGLCFSTIVKARTHLRKLGLVVCLNPLRAGPDQPSVYEMIDRPVQRVGGAQTPSLPERVAHARDMRRLQRQQSGKLKKQPAAIVVRDWPEDTPLPLGARRASPTE